MNDIQFNQAIYKKLTDRELQVARYAKDGLSLKEAAERLGVTKSTIGNYRIRIMAKVGKPNMTAAVVSLMDAGIL